jgi:hypothetical protein
MMFHPQGSSKHSRSLLAVTCGENSEDKLQKDKRMFQLAEVQKMSNVIFDFGYGEKRERRQLGVWVEKEKKKKKLTGSQ